MIYFIKALNTVKIGYSANPEKRLKELQTGNSEKLELLLTIPGNKESEKAFHLYFDRARLNGEWFRLGSLGNIHSLKIAIFATAKWPYAKYKQPKNINEFITNGYHYFLVQKATKRSPRLLKDILKVVGKDDLQEYLNELKSGIADYKG